MDPYSRQPASSTYTSMWLRKSFVHLQQLGIDIPRIVLKDGAPWAVGRDSRVDDDVDWSLLEGLQCSDPRASRPSHRHG